MITELTTEHIVTGLIAKNEIVKPSSCEFITEHLSLGDYLKNLPKDDYNAIDLASVQNTKYSFIQNGKWKF